MARSYWDIYDASSPRQAEEDTPGNESGQFQELLQRQCDAALTLSSELEAHVHKDRPAVIVRLGS